MTVKNFPMLYVYLMVKFKYLLIRWCWFTLLIWASTVRLLGQESRRDSTEVENDTLSTFVIPFEFGIYLESKLEAAPTSQDMSISSQLGIGLSVKQFSVGIFRYHFEKPYDEVLVFPNDFTLNYTYGGGYFNIRVLRLAFFESSIRINYAKGDMIWKQTSNGDEFIRDEFQIIQPELIAGFVPFKYVMIFMNLGYRKMHHLDLTGVDQKDFSGVALGVGLRIGFYNQ